jgi:uncharacterized protein YdhG (YjbR/CyaY superfamily)
MIPNKPLTVEEYIAGFPEDTQKILELIRATIKKAAPKAEEVISYSMPAFRQKGILVYYAAQKNHIGFYPTASAIAAFKKDMVTYKGSKGTVQFPYDRPIPFDLISEIVKFRVKENDEKSKTKK